MITAVVAVVAVAAGGMREAEQAGPVGLLLLKNIGLIGQHYTHISAKRLHVLCEEDSVLLGLVPESIKALSKGEHRVLEVR